MVLMKQQSFLVILPILNHVKLVLKSYGVRDIRRFKLWYLPLKRLVTLTSHPYSTAALSRSLRQKPHANRPTQAARQPFQWETPKFALPILTRDGSYDAVSRTEVPFGILHSVWVHDIVSIRKKD